MIDIGGGAAVVDRRHEKEVPVPVQVIPQLNDDSAARPIPRARQTLDYSLTFEFQTRPPTTLRGTVAASHVHTCVSRAMQSATKALRPRHWSSAVIVITPAARSEHVLSNSGGGLTLNSAGGAPAPQINSAHARNLPISVQTLNELSRLPDEILEAGIADGR